MLKFGDPVQIAGCTHKLRCLQTSTGNSGIDSLLGGALPNTAVCIVDEQRTRAYGDILLSYFLSEGIHNGHDVLTIGKDCDKLMKRLPQKIERDNGASGSSTNSSAPSTVPGGGGEDLRIAWRYSTVPQKSSMVTEVRNRYDLGKYVENVSFGGSTVHEHGGNEYEEGLERVRELLTRPEYSKKEKHPKKRLLRVAIRGLCSPNWKDAKLALRFVAELRLLCRNAYVVVMCTTDSTTVEPTVTRRLETSSDAYFRLVSISEEEKKALPTLDKYHGYLHIVHLPYLNSLAPFKPSAVDLVFELHRKSFDVKILHLPPAFDDSSKDTQAGGGMSCSAAAAAF